MKTVLVVEDNKNQSVLYEQELRFEGYNVILARSGKDIVKKTDEQIPDIIITEITMPIIDGSGAIIKKLAKNSKIPVIINTTCGNYKNNIMTRFADAYIVKSSDLSKLKNKTKELLDKQIEKNAENLIDYY